MKLTSTREILKKPVFDSIKHAKDSSEIAKLEDKIYVLEKADKIYNSKLTTKYNLLISNCMYFHNFIDNILPVKVNISWNGMVNKSS